jgi:hypothetical protein
MDDQVFCAVPATPIRELLRLAAGVEATCPKNDPDVREALMVALVHYTGHLIRHWGPASADVVDFKVVKGGKDASTH